MFQLTFLGTSAGMPSKHRNVTALAVECLNPYHQQSSQQNQQNQKTHTQPWILIDCGEGTQHQLLHTKLSTQKLAAICITHVHGDHCYGLPGLLASIAMSGRKDPLTLIAPQAISKLLDTITLTTELYFNFPIHFISHESLLNQPQQTSNTHTPNSHTLTFDNHGNHRLSIDLTALSYRTPSVAFGLTQHLQQRRLDTQKLKAAGIPAGATWGKLQKGEDVTLPSESTTSQTSNPEQNTTRTLKADDYTQLSTTQERIVVAGDNDRPELLTHAIRNASLLVHEATYTQDVLAKIQTKQQNPDGSPGFDPQHSTAQAVATFAQQAQLPNLILTHFSTRYQPFDDPNHKTPNMAHLRLEAQAHYQGNLWLAQDFAQYRVQSAQTQPINPT